MMAMYYVVEFPLEDEKSRGPHIVMENKVQVEENCTSVLWSVVDDNVHVPLKPLCIHNAL